MLSRLFLHMSKVVFIKPCVIPRNWVVDEVKQCNEVNALLDRVNEIIWDMKNHLIRLIISDSPAPQKTADLISNKLWWDIKIDKPDSIINTYWWNLTWFYNYLLTLPWNETLIIITYYFIANKLAMWLWYNGKLFFENEFRIYSLEKNITIDKWKKWNNWKINVSINSFELLLLGDYWNEFINDILTNKTYSYDAFILSITVLSKPSLRDKYNNYLWILFRVMLVFMTETDYRDNKRIWLFNEELFNFLESYLVTNWDKLMQNNLLFWVYNNWDIVVAFNKFRNYRYCIPPYKQTWLFE